MTDDPLDDDATWVELILRQAKAAASAREVGAEPEWKARHEWLADHEIPEDGTPLQLLGSRLANLLDDDKWNEVEPMLFAIARELAAPPSPPVGRQETIPEGELAQLRKRVKAQRHEICCLLDDRDRSSRIAPVFEVYLNDQCVAMCGSFEEASRIAARYYDSDDTTEVFQAVRRFASWHNKHGQKGASAPTPPERAPDPARAALAELVAAMDALHVIANAIGTRLVSDSEKEQAISRNKAAWAIARAVLKEQVK